ncbi:MAG TPA: hypothetical protein VJB57_11895 [Dehalococcoidia bacterium]|nr:hypothetical protein [Dehalococcoidia bacterium]
MQARSTVPANSSNLLLWVLAVLGVSLLSLMPLVVLGGGPSPSASSAVIPASNPRVAYLEFGRDADTLWLADAAHPSRREKRLSIAHALEFGIIPSLAPGRHSFVYTALPAATRSPTPETPADLWLASLDRDSKPRLLAQGLDLLVAPVWSASGESVVFRRSRAQGETVTTGQRLALLDVMSGQERELVHGNGSSLFPSGFSSDGRSLFYVRLDATGSDLKTLDLSSGSERSVARLGDGLTRDWRLSPGSDRLAYLAMSLEAGRVASRAFVLDIASGTITRLGPDADAFNPIWSPTADLAFGSLDSTDGGQAGITLISKDGESRLTESVQGFDVPLGYDKGGENLVVRNFDGATTLAPGRERLEVVTAGGKRTTITTAEVTFLGWIDP